MGLRLLLISILLLLSVSQAFAQAGLVHSESWDGFAQTGGVGGGTVTADELYDKQGGCYATPGAAYNSFSQTTDACDGGNNVLQVVNIMGDDNGICTNNWRDAAGQNCTDPLGCFPFKHRAELIPDDKTIRPDDQEEYWLGWRIWVPANFPANITESLIVTQGICAPNDGTDFDLRMHTNGQWRIGKRRTLAGLPRQDTIIDMGPIQRGTWNNFALRWKRAINATGVFQFWYNGVQQMIITNSITSQSNQPACLVKWGIYHGAKVGLSSDNKNYTIMFDDVKIAFGANHQATVSPTTQAGICGTPPDPDPPTPGDNNYLLGQSVIFYD